MKLRFLVGSMLGVSVMTLGISVLPQPSMAAIDCDAQLGVDVTAYQDPDLQEFEHWGDPGHDDFQPCELSNLAGYSTDPDDRDGYCSYVGVFSLPKDCTTWQSWSCPEETTGTFWFFMQTYAGGASTFYGSFTIDCDQGHGGLS